MKKKAGTKFIYNFSSKKRGKKNINLQFTQIKSLDDYSFFMKKKAGTKFIYNFSSHKMGEINIILVHKKVAKLV